jgi:hypothetical protein
MKKYKIANLRVDMKLYYDRLAKQASKYLTDEDTPADITIQLSEDFYKRRQAENPHLDLNAIEYIFAGSYFYNHILDFDGFLLHSSAVAKDNNAYLFSASSGTGKSTHTSLWLKNFKDAFIINDDKPAIKIEDDGIYVCGTPFSGKTDQNKNVKVPLKAICILERGEKNKIEKIKSSDAVLPILNQTIRPEDKMVNLMALVIETLKSTNVYRLYCNITDEAAMVSYNRMSKGD